MTTRSERDSFINALALGGEIPAPSTGPIEGPHYPAQRKDWAAFPVTKVTYNDPENRVRGERLLIDGWSVMEEWERPLERATAAKLLENIHGPANVLIRGEGLGYVTQAFIEGLASRGGGEIHIIELHPVVLRQGRDRVARLLDKLPYNQRASIKAEFHLGDALEVTKTFPDNYFDVIRSDTFPLSEDEKDINDMVDIDKQVRILKPTGVFSPFIGHPSLTPKQFQYINGTYFRQIVQEVFPTFPPKDCPYYQGDEMAIIICRGPRKNGEGLGIALPN